MATCSSLLKPAHFSNDDRFFGNDYKQKRSIMPSPDRCVPNTEPVADPLPAHVMDIATAQYDLKIRIADLGNNILDLLLQIHQPVNLRIDLPLHTDELFNGPGIGRLSGGRVLYALLQLGSGATISHTPQIFLLLDVQVDPLIQQIRLPQIFFCRHE